MKNSQRLWLDLGSVNAHVGKPCALAGQYLSFQPGRGRKPASWWEGGPEGLEQKKKIKVDKQEKLYIMGYYEN